MNAATVSPVNLVPDPEFADGATAWAVTAGSTSKVVAAGHGGHRALSVTNTGSASKTIAVNDAINTIASAKSGVTYTASAWIQVSAPSLSVAVRESAWKGSAAVAAPAIKSAWLQTTGWQFVAVPYLATVSGASIDLNFLAWQVPKGVSVLVSQPALTASDPTIAPAPPVVVPPTTGGKLVFDDEFNGTTVDRSKWNVRSNSWLPSEYSTLTSRPNNVLVGNGVLTIRAQRERYSVFGTTRAYTSGYLDTIGLHSQQYGRWVMRAKLPTAKGLWPAFWLRSDHTVGEVDILESVGGLNRMATQTVLKSTFDHSVKESGIYNVTGTIADWHVYGFTWTPTQMTWDIDGVTVFTIKGSAYPWTTSAIFHDTMNIRLNLQVGGAMPVWWKTDVDSTTQFPADYQVDWVRVYDS